MKALLPQCMKYRLRRYESGTTCRMFWHTRQNNKFPFANGGQHQSSQL